MGKQLLVHFLVRIRKEAAMTAHVVERTLQPQPDRVSAAALWSSLLEPAAPGGEPMDAPRSTLSRGHPVPNALSTTINPLTSQLLNVTNEVLKALPLQRSAASELALTLNSELNVTNGVLKALPLQRSAASELALTLNSELDLGL